MIRLATILESCTENRIGINLEMDDTLLDGRLNFRLVSDSGEVIDPPVPLPNLGAAVDHIVASWGELATKPEHRVWGLELSAELTIRS